MSKRVMPKMFKFQEDIVKNDFANTIIGNFSRGLGKDYTLICTILYQRPEIVYYVASNNEIFENFKKKLNEILQFNREVNKDIKNVRYANNNIKIKFNSGEYVEIYNYETIQDYILLSKNVDMVIYNETLPMFNIKAKRHISMVTIPYDNLARLYTGRPITLIEAGLKDGLESGLYNEDYIKENHSKTNKWFNSEIDIFNQYDDIFLNENNTNSFYDVQIIELMLEYSKTTKGQNTTMYREKILEQIKTLRDMKNNC